MKQKKMPQRKCVGCAEMKDKKELVRIVKAPDILDENGEVVQKGEISVDLTGKKPGRGAYVCRSAVCLSAARKARRLEKTFSSRIPDEVYDRLEQELQQS